MSKEDCNYACSEKGTLKTHIKQVHDKIKDFACPKEDCDYACSTKGDLKTHIKTCTGKRQGSSGECAIEDTLLKMNINHQMRTSWKLKNEEGNWLEWDCIIWDMGGKLDDPIFIEYDGKFHYEPHFKGNAETLQKQQHHDNLKNQFCDENNYLLLRIPYWDFANTHQIVVDYIQTNTNWNSDE